MLIIVFLAYLRSLLLHSKTYIASSGDGLKGKLYFETKFTHAILSVDNNFTSPLYNFYFLLKFNTYLQETTAPACALYSDGM